eukprot:TRINITY_DN6867_c0_g1_i2.p1 TRINITY_DN6867_c0_g1~~TRINITY_DN6867_c0_g1_i2.p1  ORF type:complete len:180 (-),score=32.47 TRINITY_DN6867_c0_g1_i2:34-573(-)
MQRKVGPLQENVKIRNTREREAERLISLRTEKSQDYSTLRSTTSPRVDELKKGLKHSNSSPRVTTLTTSNFFLTQSPISSNKLYRQSPTQNRIKSSIDSIVNSCNLMHGENLKEMQSFKALDLREERGKMDLLKSKLIQIALPESLTFTQEDRKKFDLDRIRMSAVSYTHLTLPTIYSV